MKQLYIEQLKADTGIIEEFFQLSQIEQKTTNRGSAYLSMKLRDKSGEVNAKMWDIPHDCPKLEEGSFIKIRGELGSYKDELQIKVLRMRRMEETEICLEDFIPASKYDRDWMLESLEQIVCSEMDRAGMLQHVVLRMLRDQNLRPLLHDAPAAKTNHQGYLGGLLEHIHSLLKLAKGVCDSYPDLNRDILYTAAIVHDIGKVQELCFKDHIGYTRLGSLAGHIIIGSQIWHEFAHDLDTVTYDHIAHIIASHHGNKEWGAAQVPMTREAQIFHFLDMIDARYFMMTKAVENGVDKDGMTNWNPKLGCMVWNGGKVSE